MASKLNNYIKPKQDSCYNTYVMYLKVIVGLGKTGFSCVRYLWRQGFNIAVVDTRSEPPFLQQLKQEFPQIPIYLNGLHEDILDKADELVLSPGVVLKKQKQWVPVIGDIELFARAAKAPIIAITGSNGKSTVTTLVGEMAKNAGLDIEVGGNLGTPALDLLRKKEPDLYVLELSSFQLETTYSLRATAAVVLNISPDHMDRYDNFVEYKAAKMRIYNGCKVAVVNRMESKMAGISFALDAPRIGHFGVRDDFLAYGNKKLLPISELYIKGEHQVANALAALALGTAVNLPMTAMVQTLRTFKGLAHRCEWVTKIDGVDWYNDSKGTNVGAMHAAIKGLGATINGKIILIAGGQGKNQDFSMLINPIRQYVKALILIGEDALKIATALKGSCEILYADSMQTATILAKSLATSGYAVLLSPGCASFDMFRNFEHRGEVFKENVKQLQT